MLRLEGRVYWKWRIRKRNRIGFRSDCVKVNQIISNCFRKRDFCLRGPLNILEGHSKPIYGICFHPEGNIICSGSEDNTMKTWNPITGEMIHTFIGHTNDVICVVATNSGVAITGSEDKSIKTWNIDTATCIGIFFSFVNILGLQSFFMWLRHGHDGCRSVYNGAHFDRRPDCGRT